MGTEIVALQANAINGCDKLKYINVDELVNLRQLAGSAIATNSLLFANETLDLSKTSIISIGGSGAMSNNRDATLILPETLTTVGDYPFEKNPNLEKVVFNSTPSFSGTNHFNNCTSLTTVEGFEKLTIQSIPSGFFQNCTSLTSITIPETVTAIGTSFGGCTNLKSVTIPAGVTSVNASALLLKCNILLCRQYCYSTY